MEIAELIAKLEKAKGPDRELDAGIWEHLGLAPKRDNSKNNYGHWHYRGGGDYHYSDDSPWGRNQLAPFYTSSIDAAMTLVPEGWSYKLYRQGSGICEGLVTEYGDQNGHSGSGYSRHPAIAICIAALKARSQGEGA